MTEWRCPMRVRRRDLPGLLGVSRQQVHKDIGDGLYGPGPDGLFDLDEVRAGRGYRSPWHGGRREPYADRAADPVEVAGAELKAALAALPDTDEIDAMLRELAGSILLPCSLECPACRARLVVELDEAATVVARAIAAARSSG